MALTTTVFEDFYAAVGVPSTASIDEISTAIRTQVNFLLDSTTEDSVVFENCTLLLKIKGILCDEYSKAEYDAIYQERMGS
ncbi:hypothetical protein KVR01_011463 [Diaporthe batatas]|uniref:uncharacterized protein n=1 Tax=Diaporthe batatas TaxID=748121 RepID=UPI001D045927|nr:uncharacterized protein KVR01_011463 [Diaporthe batatas]KAG8159020.1 hypothetical protein KVR01_011463 [Diaporthe batatas]